MLDSPVRRGYAGKYEIAWTGTEEDRHLFSLISLRLRNQSRRLIGSQQTF
jgi:hypothetical protein